MLQPFEHHRAVGFMDELQPILKLIEANTQVVEEPAIGKVDRSTWSRRLYQRRDIVQDQTQIPLGGFGGPFQEVISDPVPPIARRGREVC
jgi:hypothetical protein